MTTDRAAAAIADINAAMDDWEHADAFRYVAPWDEPVVRDPSGAVEWAMADGLDGYAATASARIGQWIALGFIPEYPGWVSRPPMMHRHHVHVAVAPFGTPADAPGWTDIGTLNTDTSGRPR